MSETVSTDKVGLLIDRLRGCKEADNALDIAVEIALFTPDAQCASVRANNAGTKLVYTMHSGDTVTHWAWDWTLTPENREEAIKLLSSPSTIIGRG